MLRGHEVNKTSDFVIVALLQLGSLNHQGNELAVLAPAHLSAEQRLPCGRLKVLAIDDSKTSSYGPWRTTFYKSLLKLLPFGHAEQDGLRGSSETSRFRKSGKVGQ